MKKDKVAYYTDLLKEMFLEVLVENGFDDGYDFDLAYIDVHENPHYLTPRYNGSLNRTDDLIYVPEGVKFEAFYELSFIEYEGKLEIRKNDREHFIPYDTVTSLQEEKERTNKGPYPGSKYFKNELANIDVSLQKHKPILIVSEFPSFEILLGKGMDVLLERGVSFYELSLGRVQIVLLISENRALYIGVKFIYNLANGNIEEQELMRPPVRI